MAGAVKERRSIADYLDVSATSTADYALMGTGFTDLDESLATKTTSKRYINMASESKNVVGYDWSAPFTTDVIPDEKAVAFICEIGEKEYTGAKAEADYVKVDLEKSAGGTTEFEARKRRVSVEVADFKSNDGEMQASGNLLGKTDWIPGKFDTATKIFTPEA